MTTYSIKVLKNGRILTRKQISKGLVKTEAVVMKAGADQTYVFSDALMESKSPVNIQTRRVGQDLHIGFGDSSVAAPDLIIEGYFDFPIAPLLGTLSDGNYAPYDINPILALAQSPSLSKGEGGQAEYGASAVAESALADPQPYAGLSGWQLAGAGGLGVLALAGSGGGGGGGNESNSAQASQAKINSYANDSSLAAPGIGDYIAVGVADASAMSAAKLSLLNDAVVGKTSADVDTVAELNALAAAVNAVLTGAAGGVAPSLAQLNLLGLTGVTADNLVSIQTNVASTADDGTGVDTMVELQAIVNASFGLPAVTNYATSKLNAAPTVADYTSLSVTGVSTSNIGAINSAVDALDASAVNSAVKIQSVVDAYSKILAEANASAADATPSSNPFANDYATIGANIGLAGTNLYALSLLNDIVGGLNTTAVDSITEINALAKIVDRLMGVATGSVATFTVEDLNTIGIATAGAGAVTSVNLGAVNEALGHIDVPSHLYSLVDLQALVGAVATIVSYADANSRTAPTVTTYANAGLSGVTSINLAAINSAVDAATPEGVDTKAEMQALINTYAASGLPVVTNYATSKLNAAPTVADYTSLSVTGVSTSNIGAINSAVDALDAPAVNSAAKIQSVVDAYSKILAEANGSAADATPSSNPFANDYATIGANIGLAVSNPYALSLLNDIVGGLNTTAVDSIDEINALAKIVDRLMGVATGSVATFTVEDFNTIGIATAGAGAVNSVNLSAVNEALGHIDGPSHLYSLVDLQALVGAVATIVSYADANSHAAPTLTTYTSAGLSGVTSTNLVSINSAVDANTPEKVDTKAEMQAMVDAYVSILSEANGAADDATIANPGLAQYLAIGANIGDAATDPESFNLLNDAIANLNVTSVDTVAEINALAATMDKIMHLAQLPTGSAATGAPGMNELAAMGLNTAAVNTASEQTAIWQAIIDSPDSGSGVMTILQLQALINANAH